MPSTKRYFFTTLLCALVTVVMTNCVASPAAPTSWRPVPTIHTTTNVWSGYVAHAPRFTGVSATWRVPRAHCLDPWAAFAGTWVGVGGWHNAKLAQAGVDSDCAAGEPMYSAWYEIYGDPQFNAPLAPGYPVPLSSTLYPLAPNDIIHVEVTYAAPKWTFILANRTRHWQFAKSVSYRVHDEILRSAEWVLEAEPSCDPGNNPLTCPGHLPRLDPVTFFVARANGPRGWTTPLAFARTAVSLRVPHSTARPHPLVAPGGVFTISSTSTARTSGDRP